MTPVSSYQFEKQVSLYLEGVRKHKKPVFIKKDNTVFKIEEVQYSNPPFRNKFFSKLKKRKALHDSISDEEIISYTPFNETKWEAEVDTL